MSELSDDVVDAVSDALALLREENDCLCDAAIAARFRGSTNAEDRQPLEDVALALGVSDERASQLIARGIRTTPLV